MALQGRLTVALVVLAGCGPATQVFGLELEGDKAKATFAAIDTCARNLGHTAVVSNDAVTIQVKPDHQIAYRFVDGAKELSMVTSVETDNDRGALPNLKRLGDAIWECAAKKTAPATSASASAEPSAEPTAVPSVEPTAVPTAEPTVAPSATPSVAPTASPSAVPSAAPTTSVSVPPPPPPP